MMRCQYWRNVTLPALVVAMVVGLGCSAMQPRFAQVIPQMATSPTGEVVPLRSATLFYRRATSPGSSDVNSDVPRTSHVGEQQSPDEVQLLAIRFPNPSGRRETALAELVVVDATMEPTTGPAIENDKGNIKSEGWQNRLGGWLRGAMPGVAWSDGVKEAKALTLSVQEMQQLLASCERKEFQLATTSTGLNGAMESGAMDSQLLIDINGKTELQPGGRSDALDTLVRRIRSQGQLISCLVGSGAELAEMASVANPGTVAIAGSKQENLLVRLPPIHAAGRLPNR